MANCFYGENVYTDTQNRLLHLNVPSKFINHVNCLNECVSLYGRMCELTSVVLNETVAFRQGKAKDCGFCFKSDFQIAMHL